MNTNNLEKKLDGLQKSLDTLILIEVAKSGATREQARKALGGIRNETYSSITSLFSVGRTKK